MFPPQIAILLVLFGICQAAWNVTCDLDLEHIEKVVYHLPVECQTIYKSGPASELYKASMIELKSFKQFDEKLTNYERKTSSTPQSEIPKQNTVFRYKIYKATMLNECAVNIANRTDLLSDDTKTMAFYDCLVEKRQKMIDFIPQ